MKFCIVVYAAPYSSQAASTALRYTRCLLESGHEVTRLFFFGDGVHNANKLAVVAQDEVNLQQQWDQLITTYNLNSVVCVSSAIRRGVVDEQESKRQELNATSLKESSEIAGLGQLVDAVLHCDRVVNFG